jgi:Domain of unknown function (DUF932)
MSLMLHAGAEVVTHDFLHQMPTPEATRTHVPIAHSGVVDMVKYSLGFYGHEIVAEDYGVTPDGMRFFGVLSLRSPYGEYTDTVGLRNSHDKTFPIGISFGSRVFVCDNLAFSGDTVIKRKHTANAKRDLPGIVAEVVEPLAAKRAEQNAQFARYQATELSDPQVNHLIMQLYRAGAITVTKIADVLGNFENPPFDWGGRTAWRLFNAVSYGLSGRVVENPRATTELHNVLDAIAA